MKNKLKKEIQEFKVLMKNVPASILTIFVLSVVLMNILANKELISVGSWLALDCGMLISWLAFFTMDVIARRFGPKASTKLNVVAISINLFVALIFTLVSKIDGNWSAAYNFNPDLMTTINSALDSTIAGTWYVLFGSTVAFFISGLAHALTNWTLNKFLKGDNQKTYLIVSYISTSLAQFVDNLLFALIVSNVFFGWTLLQCITCALTGMIMELVFEFVFAPFGYRLTEKWRKQGIGEEYLEAIGGK